MVGCSGARGHRTSTATLSQTRSESWGSGKGVHVRGGAVSPLASCHSSVCSAEPVWVSSGVSSPIPFHPQSLIPPQSLPLSPHQD